MSYACSLSENNSSSSMGTRVPSTISMQGISPSGDILEVRMVWQPLPPFFLNTATVWPWRGPSAYLLTNSLSAFQSKTPRIRMRAFLEVLGDALPMGMPNLFRLDVVQ